MMISFVGWYYIWSRTSRQVFIYISLFKM